LFLGLYLLPFPPKAVKLRVVEGEHRILPVLGQLHNLQRFHLGKKRRREEDEGLPPGAVTVAKPPWTPRGMLKCGTFSTARLKIA